MLVPTLKLPTITQEVALNTKENWCWCTSLKGRYKVSDTGRVKSVSRWVVCSRKGTKRFIKGRILKQVVGSHGYLVVNLRKKGTGKVHCVHRLVLEAFMGSCPVGKQGLHKDDNRKNNKLSNLYWGTPKQNMRDAKRNGKRENAYLNHPKCENNHNAKLTKKDVRRIRTLCTSSRIGLKSELAREYGVSQTLITNIVKGKCWKSIL